MNSEEKIDWYKFHVLTNPNITIKIRVQNTSKNTSEKLYLRIFYVYSIINIEKEQPPQVVDLVNSYNSLNRP